MFHFTILGKTELQSLFSFMYATLSGLGRTLKMFKHMFQVFDGPDRSSQQLLNQTCGDSVPAPLFSSGNVLMLVLSTDEKTVKKGVHLLWRGIQTDTFLFSQNMK